MPDNSAVAVRCGLDGSIEEVIYDKLGLHSRLASGGEFAAVIAPIHLRKATRFLETVRSAGSALDWELHVDLPEGRVPVYFSACVAGPGVIIVGARAPLADASQRKTPRYAVRISHPLDHEWIQGVFAEETGPKRRRKGRGPVSQAEETSGHGSLLWLEVAAHDLRNPVSGILAATQFLIEDAGRNLQPHHMALLASIESSSQFMLRLLQDLSEIPALESSRLQYDFDLIDAGSLVENAVFANRPLAESKRVNLELKIVKPAPKVLADAFKIRYALNSLLANAIRCSPADTNIEICAGARNRRAVITLRGEAPGKLAHDLKFLLHSSRGDRQKSGLSHERAALTLGMAERIVAGHRGTIQFGREGGQDSVLTLALPISEETPRNARTRRPAAKKARTSSP